MALEERVPLQDTTTSMGRTRRRAPFGAPHVYVLVVIEGPDISAAHRIGQSETIIGRGEGAHFILEDEQISKEHFKIRVEGSVCTIMELGSRNGTTVNGRPIRKDVAQRLRHLDEIQVGKHRLFLLAGRYRDQPKNMAV